MTMIIRTVAFSVCLCLLSVLAIANAEVLSVEEYYSFINENMSYVSIDDVLGDEEPHISQLITETGVLYTLDNFHVFIEEVVTDGYRTYINVAVEAIQPEITVLPLECATENNLFFVPLHLHDQLVGFVSVDILGEQGQAQSLDTVWALSDDLQRLELVCSYRDSFAEMEILSFPNEIELNLLLNISYYEHGEFTNTAVPIAVTVPICRPTYEFLYEPLSDVTEKAREVGITPPAFAVILTPFQLYTPGLSVSGEPTGQSWCVPEIGLDGTQWAWVLRDGSGKMYVDGITYPELSNDLCLSLIDLTNGGKIVASWPIS